MPLIRADKFAAAPPSVATTLTLIEFHFVTKNDATVIDVAFCGTATTDSENPLDTAPATLAAGVIEN